jgi:filamentous hemagglutinin family protein
LIHWQLGIIAALGLVCAGKGAIAQIVPDETLGAESSIVMPLDAFGLPVDRIGGGAIRGTNLFHSFWEFNVEANRDAFFFSPNADIQNILARVTGGNPSQILGTLGTFGNSEPNLFLMNPRGIVFGENARLAVGGSFVASTADSLLFENGFEFSSTNPEAPPLLTINIPIGLQYGSTPGGIVNQSVRGLQVQPERTLALVGGEVALENGKLKVPDGRIELGSVAGNNRVNLTLADRGYVLGYEGVEDFQNIRLSQAGISTSGNSGGSIQVQGREVRLSDGTFMFADTEGSGNGGGIFIKTEQLTLEGASLVAADVFGSGQGGDITVETEHLLIREGSAISASPFSEGSGGSLIIDALESVQVIEESANRLSSSSLSTSSFGSGKAGNVEITTAVLHVADGAQVGAGIFGEGEGGSLIVHASELVQVIGTASNSLFPSGLFTQSEGSGKAGNMEIITAVLHVVDGAKVGAGIFGEGEGGSLIVHASESVQVIGRSADGQVGSRLSVQSEGSGKAGNMEITTTQLHVVDGAQVSAGTFGEGKGGSLIIHASELVQLIGTSANGQIPSGLFTSSASSGKAGNLTIETEELLVSDGATVAVSSLQSQAGDLSITADSVFLNQGTLFAETAVSGSEGGANIILQNLDLLLLENESLIDANALEDANGGNVTIDADFIVAKSPTGPEGSDITANAVRGNGGRVSVTSNGLFGIEFRPQRTPLNDITVSSQFGLAGDFIENTPGIDPSQGLATLPSNLVDPESLIDRSCTPGSAALQSSFIITGRGGIPTSPTDPLSSNDVVSEWVTLDTEEETTEDTETPPNPTSTTPERIIEAQGWIVNEQGQVVLVANAPTVSPQTPRPTAPSCEDIRASAN